MFPEAVLTPLKRPDGQGIQRASYFLPVHGDEFSISDEYANQMNVNAYELSAPSAS